MTDIDKLILFNRARIDDRQVNELLGLAKGIIADGAVNQREAEALHAWLEVSHDVRRNPIVATLLDRIREVLHDGRLADEEARDLLSTLRDFSAGDIEIGELMRATTLPFDNPAPDILVSGRRFVFTGTFAFGSRPDCEARIRDLGGIPAPRLTRDTDYLVVGIYASDAWAHSAFGRKIEQAAEWRAAGVPIAIVGEAHWRSCI